MAHFEGTLIAQDGKELHFQSWEAEITPKAVICLVHGLGEHGGRYAHVARALNQAGYHVLALDLRGHGKTQGKRGDLPPYDVVGKDVDLLFSEASKRYPSLPQILYGHSMGGIVALYYGLRFKPKIAGVVVTSPGLFTALELQKGKVLLAKLLGALMPGMTMPTGLDANGISRDSAVVERYKQDPLVHGQATLGLANYSLEAIRYIYQNGKAWSLPLLLMHGTEDQIAYAEGSKRFAALVDPSVCTFRLWDGCLHELHNEPVKEEVFAFMIEQLDRFIS